VKKTGIGLPVIAVLVALAVPEALAAAKKEAPAKLPPGWNTKWTGTLMCPRCTGLGYDEGVGTCGECKKGTASGAFRLCPVCALKAKKCSRCLSSFPAQPTAGLKLEISWLKPELKIKDSHMNVDSAESIPIWITVVNTTAKDIPAPDFLSRSRGLAGCETLIFVARSGRKEKVLFNVSPWIKRRRALAPRPVSFKPGSTTFERDLAKCYCALGKLGAGRHTVKAAVGWLESNELSVSVGSGGTTVVGPALDPKDPAAQKMLAELRETWKMSLKRGEYAKAVEIARRIAQVHPDLGRKMLAVSEAYLKKHHARDAERHKREAEDKDRLEQIRREEEMKKRALEKMKRDEELKRRMQE